MLANIALHGLETAIRAAFPSKRRGVQPWKPLVIRYADDFVVLHEDAAVIEHARQVAADWLAGMGLELKLSKTRVTHTLHPHDGSVGFDFLGFHVRQFRVGRTHAATNRYGTMLAFKTIIKPSPVAQRRHLADVIRRHRQVPHQALVDTLNPKIRGWANYYSAQVSKAVFGRLDHLTYQKLKRWAERRHPTKSHSWVRSHYWHTREDRGIGSSGRRKGDRFSCTRTRPSVGTARSKEPPAPLMATSSTGRVDWAVIPNCPSARLPCSDGNTDDVPGVDWFSPVWKR